MNKIITPESKGIDELKQKALRAIDTATKVHGIDNEDMIDSLKDYLLMAVPAGNSKKYEFVVNNRLDFILSMLEEYHKEKFRN